MLEKMEQVLRGRVFKMHTGNIVNLSSIRLINKRYIYHSSLYKVDKIMTTNAQRTTTLRNIPRITSRAHLYKLTEDRCRRPGPSQVSVGSAQVRVYAHTHT